MNERGASGEKRLDAHSQSVLVIAIADILATVFLVGSSVYKTLGVMYVAILGRAARTGWV